jgi:hypothetical protein
VQTDLTQRREAAKLQSNRNPNGILSLSPALIRSAGLRRMNKPK